MRSQFFLCIKHLPKFGVYVWLKGRRSTFGIECFREGEEMRVGVTGRESKSCSFRVINGVKFYRSGPKVVEREFV